VIGAIVLAGALGALGWRVWNRVRTTTKPASVLVASGTIEVEEIEVAAEVGGRVVTLHVDEGDEVQAGDLLVQLDDSIYLAQLAQAEAAVDAARAALERVELGATPEEIAQAKAAVAQAVAAREGTAALWRAARAAVEDPQQAIAQYHAALGARDSANANAVSVAQSGMTVKEDARRLWYNAANILRDAQANYSRIYWRNRETEKERDLTQAEIDEEDSAWRRVEDTERDMQMGELNYNLAETLETQNNTIAQNTAQAAAKVASDLGWIVSEPLSGEAQAAQAEAQYRQAIAAVQVARAALERARAGAAQPEIDAYAAQLRQAEAAANLLQLQVERTTLQAPASGIVLVRSIHEGELAAPGIPLLTLGNLDTVRLTIYIPENAYGKVQLGDQVQVSVDSYPDQTFAGEVIYIATTSEFTPKDVQTAEERVHLVYAVRVRVPNPDHLLKPGMPADAEIDLGTR
jgi:HlyD family secretion protein